MRVQFEFTVEDLVDASKRFAAHSNFLRAFRWKNLLATAFWAWVLGFLIFYRTPIKGAIFGLAVALVSALIYPSSNQRAFDKRMRKFALDQFGTAKTHLCEVELRPEGVWVRSMNRQTLFEWPTVKAVEDTSDSVDIFTDDGGVVVRNRAFASAAERMRFIELANAGTRSTAESGS